MSQSQPGGGPWSGSRTPLPASPLTQAGKERADRASLVRAKLPPPCVIMPSVRGGVRAAAHRELQRQRGVRGQSPVTATTKPPCPAESPGEEAVKGNYKEAGREGWRERYKEKCRRPACSLVAEVHDWDLEG